MKSLSFVPHQWYLGSEPAPTEDIHIGIGNTLDPNGPCQWYMMEGGAFVRRVGNRIAGYTASHEHPKNSETHPRRSP
jgi:hypothetical protein